MSENQPTYKPIYIFILELSRHQCLADHGGGPYELFYKRESEDFLKIEVTAKQPLEGSFNVDLFTESAKYRIGALPDKQNMVTQSLDLMFRLERAIADEIVTEYRRRHRDRIRVMRQLKEVLNYG